VKKILVLGAGQSTSYLISSLLGRAQELDWFVTVCDRNGELAAERVAGHSRGQSVVLDANDPSTRASLLKSADVVVNMLTRPYQYPVAIDCLNNQAHMLTASYEDPKVRALDTEAHRKGILILNEMGLDPGIDHMIAMSMIQRVHESGGVVTSLRSYGGGLPAPEEETNPLRYAITWNPRNVLMAGEDGALYKEGGKFKLLPFHAVFERTWTVEVDGVGTLEAYPNRDSLTYETVLGLRKTSTIIRGTLRYPGWCETWQQIIRLGLANEALRITNLKNMTYAELTGMCLPPSDESAPLEQQVAGYLGISVGGRIMDNLRYLGLFSAETIGNDAETVSQAMLQLIKNKLRMPSGARDVVILIHEMEVEYPVDGITETITSTMIEYGAPGGGTAIARTVGLPITIAIELLLTGRLQVTGCRIPTHPAIYEPVLMRLKDEGLVIRETVEAT
jgi:saccharopine dehydrogenase (NADP+, L-glutamate forming)